MNLEELLKSNRPPKKDEITDEDLTKLFMKYKGLLKQGERDKAFSAATHENIRIAYAKLDELVEARTAELRKTNEQLQQEITQHKQAEEALKESEEKLKTILENTHDMIFQLSPLGKIQYVSPKVEELYGYKPEDLIGKHLRKTTPVSELPKALKTLKSVLSGKVINNFEINQLNASGKIILMEINITPVRRGDKIIAVQGVMRDITERRQAEKALRESERRFKDITENASEWVWETDVNGKYIYASPVCEKILGYKPEELLEKHFYDLFLPEEREQLKKAAFEAFVKKQSFREFINPNVHKNGEIVWLSTSGVPILDERGNLLGYRGADIDITERMRVEEELETSRTQMQAILNGSPDGIRQVDTNLRVLWANKTSLIKNPDAIGQTCHKAFMNRDEPCEGCPSIKAIETGQIAMNVIYQPFTRGVQGESCWEDVGVPVKDSDGKVIGAIQIARDITERRQAEEALRESERRFKDITENASDWVWETDVNGKYIYASPVCEKILGYKPEELLEKHFYDLFLPEEREQLKKAAFEAFVKKQSFREFINPNVRKNGEIVWLSTSGVPILDERGNLLGYRGADIDITERKKMEEQLTITDRLASIGELASGIAHELNNPLTSIVGFSDLLLNQDVSGDVKEDLKVINREAQRTVGVVRNLLTFARKHAPEKQPVDINNIIQTVLELRTYEQKVNNIQVNTQFAPDLPEITADGFQLQQVFINIIINAEHFMIEAHRRGTLTITTERVGDIIRASFADDGPGIAKENLGHLFDPFFTTKEVGKGTGLGLSISYGIITEHGGRIYANSRLGNGATFVVELPLPVEQTRSFTPCLKCLPLPHHSVGRQP